MGFYVLGRLIPWYGFFIALGLGSASFLSYYLCKKTQKLIEDFIILASWLLSAGFFGAKLLFVIVSFNEINWAYYFSSIYHFSEFLGSGFVFYGGLLGGLAVLPLVQKIHKIRVKDYMEILCPCVALTHAFGRIGCSFAGCCHGDFTEGPLYFMYTQSIAAPNGVPLFPVQAIEAFCLFVLTAVLVVLVLKKVKFSPAGIYLVTYSIVRFILEFFRGDEARGFLGFLSTSQVISIVIFIIGLAVILHGSTTKRTNMVI